MVQKCYTKYGGAVTLRTRSAPAALSGAGAIYSFAAAAII
jgi:hypothetical protein